MASRSPRKREQCPVIYTGESYPSLHGTRCAVNHHPHPGERHSARPTGEDGPPLLWWTPAEKEAIRGGRQAAF